MTFIVYDAITQQVMDVYPGCWDDQKDSNKWIAWDNMKRIAITAYCVDHNCEHNHWYKPENYIRKEDR